MAFVVKSAKVIRNNWKKSLFALCLSAYGVKYFKDRQEEELIRREFCQEAEKYGNDVLKQTERPRKVTVFLNPASRGGKGTKLFNKNAAPILYLAGMEVNVVKTEYEGQVKEFIKVLETQDTDAVVIAGGDGTLLEAVTGFMRKEDQKFRTIPVGVIPLGATNRFAHQLFGSGVRDVKLIAEAAMAIIKGQTQQIDVMKIEGSEGKATYAVSGLEAGLFRDAEQRKTKNWYFGPLKHYWTYIRTTLRKDWPLALEGKLKYVVSTEENTRLVAPRVEEPPKQQASWSWLGLLYNTSPKPTTNVGELVMDDMMNVEEERDVKATEFTIMSSNYSKEANLPALDVGIGPGNPKRREFISEGWRRVKEREGTLLLGSDRNDHLNVKSVQFEPHENTTEGHWFSIDGEQFEAMPINISLLRNRIRMFCRPTSVS